MDSKPPGKPSEPIDIPLNPRQSDKKQEESESSSPGKWMRKSVEKDAKTETSFNSDPFAMESGTGRKRLQTMQPDTSYRSPLLSSGGSSEQVRRHFTLATGQVEENMKAFIDTGFMEELRQKIGAADTEAFKEDMAKRMTLFFEDDDIPYDDDGYERVSTPSSLKEEPFIPPPTPTQDPLDEPISTLEELSPEFRYTDLSDKNSPLAKTIKSRNLKLDKFSDYEKQHLQTSAHEHLCLHNPKAVNEDTFKAFLAEHQTLVERLMPEASETLIKQRKASRPLTLSSFKPMFTHEATRTEWKKLVRDTLQLLEQPIYAQQTGVLDPDKLIRNATELLDSWTNFTSPDKKGLKPELASCLESDLNTVNKAILLFIEAMGVVARFDCRSRENFIHSVNLQCSAAIRLLTDRGIEGSSPAMEKILELQSKATMRFDPAAPMIPRLLGLQKKILSALAPLKLGKKYQGSLINVIQESEGTRSIDKELMMKYPEGFQHCQLQYLPAALLAPPVSSDDLSHLAAPFIDLFHPGYKNKFCPSMKRNETGHAVNLMNMILKMTGIEDPVYMETRVGLPYAFAVPEHHRRKVTNRRLDEMIIASLLQKKPEALAQAIGNPRHDPIDIDVCYKLLLSPDKLRPNLMEHEKNDPELIWCQKVREAVKQIREHGTRIVSIRDQDGEEQRILVKPRIHLFIDPCNNMAFTKLGAMTGTWELADEVNRETLTELMGSMVPESAIGGEVGELIRKETTPAAIKQELIEVVRYIRFMYENDRHHKLTRDPFYTSNLTSELCRLLDFANVLGCKSAKDRSGLKSAMDIKFCIDCFMARARWLKNGMRGSITPKPGQPVTFADIFNACQLILNSGQMENQLKNTGIPGFKVPGYMLGIATAIFNLINRDVSPQTSWLK
ncbi:MAG: inositol phosphate phosphatase SopB [Endozoicomonas sp.]|uniref:inositol phosphate phosphatase SopB n=1 Tax=Endozoicomonas sp. TaxID=1892382 RepID=UPI003D9B89A5